MPRANPPPKITTKRSKSAVFTGRSRTKREVAQYAAIAKRRVVNQAAKGLESFLERRRGMHQCLSLYGE